MAKYQLVCSEEIIRRYEIEASSFKEAKQVFDEGEDLGEPVSSSDPAEPTLLEIVNARGKVKRAEDI